MSRYNSSYNPYGAYELKRMYRRNLVIADLSVLGLLALLIGVAWVTGMLEHREMVTITQQDIDRSVHVITAMMESPRSVRRIVTVAKPEVPKGRELMVNIQVTPDAPEPMPLDSHLVYSDTANGRSDSLQSYSESIGDGEVGIYPSASGPSDEVTNHSVVPCSVLVAVQPEYPWVARERHKEGVAGLIVCVGASGKVTLFSADVVREFEARQMTVEEMMVRANGQEFSFNYVVTIEEPDGWFFARKVAEVLPQWVFAPSTVDGEAVPTLIPVGHAFCLTGECDKAYRELRRYKRFDAGESR